MKPTPRRCAAGQGFRHITCPDEESCLAVAGRNDWPGYSCAGCPQARGQRLLDIRRTDVLVHQERPFDGTEMVEECPYCTGQFGGGRLCRCHWRHSSPWEGTARRGDRRCGVEGCHTQRKRLGLCEHHLVVWILTGSVHGEEPVEPREELMCQTPGCGQPGVCAGNRCDYHYRQRWYMGRRRVNDCAPVETSEGAA